MNKNDLAIKLLEIKRLTEQCLKSLTVETKSPQTADPTVTETQNAFDHVAVIVNKVKNCDEAPKFESKVLAKRDVGIRVLLPFYVCHKYFPEQRLTTGDIEKISAELGGRIKTPNVSAAIKNCLWKYLDSPTSRLKGRATNYRLNRRGAEYFSSVLIGNGEK